MRCTCLMIAGGAALLAMPCAAAQISQFPFRETFDSVAPPALPAGWRSTANRSSGSSDFATAAGTARSAPNAVLATNATVEQELYSPSFDLSAWVPDVLEFYTRRSSTFRARIVVEASTDAGGTFDLMVGDTIRASASTGYEQTRLDVPRVLTGKDAVVFRWRIVPDATGTTGTFRIDDVTVSVLPAHDLGVTRVRMEPATPIEPDPVSAFITMVNRGGVASEPAVLRLRCEVPGGGQSRDLLVTTVPGIAQGDSLVVTATLGSLPPGICRLIAEVTDSLDQDHSNDTLRADCRIGYSRGSAAVNEIMYAPAAPEPEWVEILNRRRDTLSIQDWSMSDAAAGTRHILSPVQLHIPPGGFAVLTKDSIMFRDARPSVRSPVVQVQGFPSLNNDGDAVVIFDLAGHVMDSLAYSPDWGGIDGHSLERIDDEAPSTNPSNWGACRNALKGTPGDSNSIARKSHDMAVDSLTAFPVESVAGNEVLLTAWVRNAGREAGSADEVTFDRLTPGDQGTDVFALLATVPDRYLVPPLGTRTVSVPCVPRTSGSVRYRVRMSPSLDEDSTNNVGTALHYVRQKPGSVRINEMMFDPPEGFAEWVELVNISDDTVNLTDWKIGNRNARYRIPGDVRGIPPGGYLVVTKDTVALRNQFGSLMSVQVPSLPVSLWNNSSDAVVIIDPKLRVEDSVWYRSSWSGRTDVSLERLDAPAPSLDSLNWSGSVDPSGATPGRINSVAILPHDVRAGRVWTGPDAAVGSLRVHAVVQNVGKSRTARCSIVFFADPCGDTAGASKSFIGRSVMKEILAPGDSAEFAVVWKNPQPGLWNLIAAVDAPGDERPANNTATTRIAVPFPAGTLIFNEIMYDPLAGRSEYIEVLNRSGSSVDMQGWTMARRTMSGGAGKVLLSPDPCTLPSGGYLLAASDSDVVVDFPSLMSRDPALTRVGSWGSFALSNSGEEIILCDAAGAVIDSVTYSPLWHRSGIGDVSGHSLERISPALGSNDARNWSTCVDGRGGTPEEKNSISLESQRGENALSFSPNPFSPDGDGYEDFTMIHYRLPVPVAVFNIKIFDVRGRLVRWLANHEATGMQGEVVWDGRSDGRVPVRVGVYIILLEGSDDRGNVRWSERGAVVVARRL